MDENEVIAQVLWFNEAKGFGIVRAENVVLDDIRVYTSTIEDIEDGLFRDMLVKVKYKKDLIGLVAIELTLIESD